MAKHHFISIFSRLGAMVLRRTPMAEAKQVHTRVVSDTPTRARVKVSRKRRNRHEMARIAHKLQEQPGVVEVRTNVQTGSIVVRNEPGRSVNIKGILEDLGIILESAINIDIPSVGASKDSNVALADAIARLSQQLGLNTSGLINLRVLIPLGFGALSVLQLVRRGLQIDAAPWYVLAFAAIESYLRLNTEQEPALQQQES
jgi:hypothetical protein